MFRFIFSVLAMSLLIVLNVAHRVSYCAEFCPPCQVQEIAECPSVSEGCPHVVMQSGCGCCRTCALREGDRCGIGRDPCGPQLTCRGSQNTLNELINNNATCQRTSGTLPGNSYSSRRIEKFTSLQVRRIGRRHRRHPHFYRDGPCTVHLDAATMSCAMLTERVWFPHCKSNGFYRPIQCISFDGTERCWCVNKNGKNLGNRFYSRNDITCP